MYLLFIWRGIRNGFEACKLHYEEHWKGWALEIETFLGPEKATSEASAIWAQKSRDPAVIMLKPLKVLTNEKRDGLKVVSFDRYRFKLFTSEIFIKIYAGPIP
jgi:hypothetical protein